MSAFSLWAPFTPAPRPLPCGPSESLETSPAISEQCSDDSFCYSPILPDAEKDGSFLASPEIHSTGPFFHPQQADQCLAGASPALAKMWMFTASAQHDLDLNVNSLSVSPPPSSPIPEIIEPVLKKIHINIQFTPEPDSFPRSYVHDTHFLTLKVDITDRDLFRDIRQQLLLRFPDHALKLFWDHGEDQPLADGDSLPDGFLQHPLVLALLTPRC